MRSVLYFLSFVCAEPNLESGANIDCCKLYRDNKEVRFLTSPPSLVYLSPCDHTLDIVNLSLIDLCNVHISIVYRFFLRNTNGSSAPKSVSSWRSIWVKKTGLSELVIISTTTHVLARALTSLLTTSGMPSLFEVPFSYNSTVYPDACSSITPWK